MTARQLVSGLCLAVFCLAMTTSVNGEDKLPTLAGSIIIGEDAGWDYLAIDTASHLLYVSHGTRVNVIDLDQNKIRTEIPNLQRVHGITFAPEFLRGFISNGGDTSITVFDLKTDSTLSKVKVSGANPDAVLYDPFTHRLFTFNGRGQNATAIDPKTLKVIGSIPLEGKPEFAVSDYKGRVYVNIEDKSVVALIDPQALKVTARWPLAPLKEPSAIAIDRKNGRLFIGGSNKLMAVMDATNGHVINTLPIGDGVDAAGFDPITHRAFSSNGDGTLTVINCGDSDKYTVAGNVTTEPGARTMALDERTHRIYLSVRPKVDTTLVPKKDFEVLVYQQ